MVKHAFSLLISLLALLLAPLAMASPIATVDRTELFEGESFQLTVETDGGFFSDAPDFSALEKDFEQVSGISRSSQTSINNGSIKSSTRWSINLIPRKAGTLTIPPIAVGKEKTAPITITVKPASQSDSSRHSAAQQPPVSISIEVDSTTPYVQQQVLVTVKTRLTGIAVLDWELQPPAIPDAIVESLGEPDIYDHVDNGRRFKVIEHHFALFAQKSGALTVPSFTFAAKISDSRSNRFFSSMKTRIIRQQSAEIDLEVKPIPQTFSGAFWLPAKSLQAEESWSGATDKLTPGDSVTRQITLTGKGVLLASLPDLPEPSIENLKIYADQPGGEQYASESGVTSEKQFHYAALPARGGDYRLPDIRIDWWNTETDRQETLVIPGKILHVEPLVSAPSSSQDPGENPINNPSRQTLPTDAMAHPLPIYQQVIYWQLASLFLATGWLITWLRHRRKNLKTTNSLPQSVDEQTSLEAATQAVIHASRQGSPEKTLAALRTWHRKLQQEGILPVASTLDGLPDPELKQQTSELMRIIYKKGEERWDGAQFLAAFKQYNDRLAEKDTSSFSLYPG